MSRIDPVIHEQIQQLHRDGASQHALAKQFGLARETIRRLLKRPVNWYGLDKETAAKCRSVGVSLKVAAYIIETYQDTSIADQAAHLNSTINSVRRIQYLLNKAGVITGRLSKAARERRKCRDAMLAERIARLAADGATAPSIAKQLKQPLGRITHIIRKLGGMQALRGDVYNLDEVANLFQVTWATARNWVKQGWLTAKRNPRPCSVFAVRRFDLIAFIAVRAAWPSYAPQLIRDEELRSRALQVQQSAGGRWYSRREIAIRAGVHLETVRHWREKGYLQDMEATTYGHATYYWLPDGHPLFAVSAVSISEAARTLHLSRPTLYKYIREFGMPVEANNKLDLGKVKTWLQDFTPPKTGRPATQSQGARL